MRLSLTGETGLTFDLERDSQFTTIYRNIFMRADNEISNFSHFNIISIIIQEPTRASTWPV